MVSQKEEQIRIRGKGSETLVFVHKQEGKKYVCVGHQVRNGTAEAIQQLLLARPNEKQVKGWKRFLNGLLAVACTVLRKLLV